MSSTEYQDFKRPRITLTKNSIRLCKLMSLKTGVIINKSGSKAEYTKLILAQDNNKVTGLCCFCGVSAMEKLRQIRRQIMRRI